MPRHAAPCAQTQFWDYLEGHLVNQLFVNTDYRGTELPRHRLGYVLEVDKMIGAVRFEQKRVKLDRRRCAVPPVYEELIPACYPRIRTEFDVDSQAFGPEDRFEPVSTGFFVDVGFKRFVEDIPNDATPDEAIERLESLRNDSWVDLQTREVHVKFTVYNPAVDLFCYVDLEFAFLHTGGIAVSSKFRTISMLRQWLLLTPTRIFFPPSVEHELLFVLELVFLLIVLFMLVGEVRQFARLGFYMYISSVWNVIDVLNLSLFIIFFFYRFFFIGAAHGGARPRARFFARHSPLARSAAAAARARRTRWGAQGSRRCSTSAPRRTRSPSSGTWPSSCTSRTTSPRSTACSRT